VTLSGITLFLIWIEVSFGVAVELLLILLQKKIYKPMEYLHLVTVLEKNKVD
jgi:hypothetical protein